MTLEDYENWYYDERNKKEAFTEELLELCKKHDYVIVYDTTPRIEKAEPSLYERLKKQLTWWNE